VDSSRDILTSPTVKELVTGLEIALRRATVEPTHKKTAQITRIDVMDVLFFIIATPKPPSL
jgi:hypothetical protein